MAETEAKAATAEEDQKVTRLRREIEGLQRVLDQREKTCSILHADLEKERGKVAERDRKIARLAIQINNRETLKERIKAAKLEPKKTLAALTEAANLLA